MTRFRPAALALAAALALPTGLLAPALQAQSPMDDAQRKAVELCCLQGYAPGSEDPNEITAATICGVSGTAIRKNLRKAAEKLKKQ